MNIVEGDVSLARRAGDGLNNEHIVGGVITSLGAIVIIVHVLDSHERLDPHVAVIAIVAPQNTTDAIRRRVEALLFGDEQR